jgi:hypothetical protein
MIYLQSLGGLGNQLFVWAGAHKLTELFSEKICILNVIDNNSRTDRPNELNGLLKQCKHGIILRNTRFFGIIIKLIDKFSLEKNIISRAILQKLGFYTFENPVEKIEFAKGKPRFIRCYFQRDEYVDSVWKQISTEIQELFKNTVIIESEFYSKAQVIHFRRGDTVNLQNTLGVLTVDFFLNNMTSNLENLVCTDDTNYREIIENKFKTKIILTPLDTTTWQTLKIFCIAKEFIGSNSTLSWWAAKIRTKSGMIHSTLPRPWTFSNLNYETDLNISGVNFVPAQFEVKVNDT